MLAATAGGCRSDPWKGISAAQKESARRAYEARCLSCHGKTGAGDGPGAKECNPRPRSFLVSGWQSSVTDSQIEFSIVGGGAAIGKSVIMPPNPDLRDRPELVRALRAYVRWLANH